MKLLDNEIEPDDDDGNTANLGIVFPSRLRTFLFNRGVIAILNRIPVCIDGIVQFLEARRPAAIYLCPAGCGPDYPSTLSQLLVQKVGKLSLAQRA